jgi:hypothetical protein
MNRMKKQVLRSRLNTDKDGKLSVSSYGKLFQMVGAALLKAQFVNESRRMAPAVDWHKSATAELVYDG